jgi:hypothetical protein
MAMTKKRAAPKGGRSSQKQKSRSRSAAPSSKPRTSRAKSKPKARKNSKPSVPAPVETVRSAVGDTAKEAGGTANVGRAVGNVAGKAKLPLVAGGAALAGAAGGLALASRAASRHSALSLPVRKPRVKIDSSDLARAAKEVGRFSTQVGELATELQRNREQSNGHRRSPVEVVLQGLTNRR